MRNCSGAKRSFSISTNTQNGALGETGKWKSKKYFTFNDLFRYLYTFFRAF